RRQRGHGAGAVRGEPRVAGAGGLSRAGGVGERPERALGRRDGVGADPRRAGAGGAAVGGARAAPRHAGRAHAVPCRDRGPGRRAAGPGAGAPGAGARPESPVLPAVGATRPPGAGGPAMRRALLLALVALAVAAPAASAHPLGNFSVNHLTQVTVA